MPAGHEDTGEHGGMDALMAAITGDPLPPDAHDDPALLARRRSAEADVAVLRDQLVWLAEALTGERQTERLAPGATDAGRAGALAAAHDPGQGGADGPGTGPAGPEAASGQHGPGGDGVSSRSADPAGSEGDGGPAASAAAGAAEGIAAGGRGADRVRAGGPGAAGVRGPRAPGRARSVRRPGRPGGVRRGARVVLGSVAGVMALGLVAGLGWVAVRSGGGVSASSDKSADAKSRADGPAEAGSGAALSCYRLLAEGTVAGVDRRTDAPRIRVVLTVTRSYRPSHGPSEVAFLLGDAASPAPRKGQHVLAGVVRGGREATLWAVGDARVADERARIAGTGPESAPAPCDEP
ncbi:hypothetical protein ACIRU2_14415 [Streptomyces sp. NPDC101169]|uniref:hypothetical protein n=1 Tax=Streptomyces sp. NPDC101169 TaxID=3366121 RepID=UPI003828EA29